MLKRWPRAVVGHSQAPIRAVEDLDHDRKHLYSVHGSDTPLHPLLAIKITMGVASCGKRKMGYSTEQGP